MVDGGKGQLGVALAAARDMQIDVRPGMGLPIIALAKERDSASVAAEDSPAADGVPAARPQDIAEPSPEAPLVPFAPSSPLAELAPAVPRAKAKGATNRPDRVFLAHGKDPIPIGPTSAEMYVLARLRDEAHRFAVTFHRSRRKRRTVRTALAEIAGVGPVRQRALLRHFGSLKKVGEASLEELAALPEMTESAASAVRAYFAALAD